MAKMAKKTKAVTSTPAEPAAPAGTPRLLDYYIQTVRPALGKALNRTNLHAIPQLEKIVVNMGVGVAVTEKKYLEEAIGALTQVTGQKPIATLSKAAVSGFKLRENLPIGCKDAGCTNFSTGSCRWPCHGFAISVVCRARLSTATATTAWGCRSRWFSPKSTLINTPVSKA